MPARLARTAIGTFVAAIALATSVAVTPAFADKHGAATMPQDIIPMEDILAKAKQDKAGRVVEIDLDRKRGRYIYEIEIVDDQGVEWELDYDARTGELLRTERDDQ
jgi:uncharacterized membrane protein YkoI